MATKTKATNKVRKQSSNTFKVGRDAKDGKFVSVKEAKNRPNTTIVQSIKKIRGK